MLGASTRTFGSLGGSLLEWISLHVYGCQFSLRSMIQGRSGFLYSFLDVYDTVSLSLIQPSPTLTDLGLARLPWSRRVLFRRWTHAIHASRFRAETGRSAAWVASAMASLICCMDLEMLPGVRSSEFGVFPSRREEGSRGRWTKGGEGLRVPTVGEVNDVREFMDEGNGRKELVVRFNIQSIFEHSELRSQLLPDANKARTWEKKLSTKNIIHTV